jgi:hypothetical protein
MAKYKVKSTDGDFDVEADNVVDSADGAWVDFTKYVMLRTGKGEGHSRKSADVVVRRIPANVLQSVERIEE